MNPQPLDSESTVPPIELTGYKMRDNGIEPLFPAYQTGVRTTVRISHKRRTQDSNLQALSDQRFSRPLPHQPGRTAK